MVSPATMPQRPPNFNGNTRLKTIQLADMVKTTTGGPVDRQLPKVGMLAGIYLAIRGSVAGGSITAPNALGLASCIRRIRLQANAGIDVINISGAGYHYLFRETIGSEYIDVAGQSNARNAVTAVAVNLDMYIPLMVNERDPIGLIMLQHEGLTATLTVDFEADANVGTGATVTLTCTPYLDIFTPPMNDYDMPDLTLVHRILEDQQAVAAAGDFQYSWIRGTNYLKILHGLGIGAAGSDLFSRYALRVNQTDYLQNTDIKYLDMIQRKLRGRARPAGSILVDLVGTSGLGNFGAVRDAINSGLVTDMYSIITATAPGTLYTVREDILKMADRAA